MDDHTGAFLTSKQAARLLVVSEGTLRVWRHRGQGPPYVRLGDGQRGAIRYPRHELERFLASRLIRPRAAAASEVA